LAERKKQKEESLNLVPIMNLVTILIPVLLVAIKSVEIAVIDTTLPAIGAPSAPTDDVPKNPPLALSVGIMRNGLRIIGADDYLFPGGAPPAAAEGGRPPTVPCKSGTTCKGISDYNWSELNKKLVDIKKRAQDDDRDSENVILVPSSTIRYELIVCAMDASRTACGAYTNADNPCLCTDIQKDNRLFPNVVIAGGAS
jgi:biopolymer transport protein ExbD